MQDDRDKFLAIRELKIQQRAKNKDKNFALAGPQPWKTFVREEDGFKIYKVDLEYVLNNVSVDFEHGGHGYVHEFIPLDEIWVATHHYSGCSCHNVREDRKMSQKFFGSTVIHEIIEFKLMELGILYWEAHKIALWVEKKVGILKDPYAEECTEADE